MAATETSTKASPYENDVAGLRQPMVTSIGIIMGFQLAFLANWALTAETVPAVVGLADTVLALTFLVSTVAFMLVLFRLLNNRIVTNPGQRYQDTLRIYISALVLAFVGLAVALLI